MNSSATLKESLKESPADSSARQTSRDFLERVIPLCVFLFSLAYFWIPLRYCSFEPDEGIILQGAERVLHGEIPYRDFFTFYTPGSFYLLAFLFRVFGDSFVVARSSIALAGATCSLITYLLVRRTCGRATSLTIAILATATGTGFRFLVLHNWYSTTLCCLALYAAVRFVETAKWNWAFACSLCASLAFLFEQSKGAGLCVGLVGAFCILAAKSQVRRKQFNVLGFLVGFSLPIVGTFANFAVHHTLGAMIESCLWPLKHYGRANHVPYGFQNWSDATRSAIFYTGPLWTRVIKIVAISPDFVIPVLPLAAVGLLIYFSAQSFNGRFEAAKVAYYILICATVCGLLISVLISRADILHFIYLVPIFYIVLGWILGASDFESKSLLALRPYLFCYIAISFGLLGLAVLLSSNGAHERTETRRGLIVTAGKEPIISYVEARVPAGSKFLVYPYLPLYYYLTSTQSPSRYDYLQPGMNTEDQAQEVLRSLQSQQPRAVLFEPWFAEKIANSWPETPIASIGQDPVADFISRNYRVCQILASAGGWHFQYMVAKATPCS